VLYRAREKPITNWGHTVEMFKDYVFKSAFFDRKTGQWYRVTEVDNLACVCTDGQRRPIPEVESARRVDLQYSETLKKYVTIPKD
jgi:hypothetical protein